MTPEVSMTRPLANVLHIAALAAVVVFASAFDWKPKPTAELKADLVAYANSVGETELAEAVNSASGTAEWMRAAIKRGSELLKASEGGDFNDKDRLGNREFPWPRVHPLGYGESFLFTKTK